MCDDDGSPSVGPEPADDTVRTRGNGIESLTGGTAVKEEIPSWAFQSDIDSFAALVFAVVPLAQVVIRLGSNSRKRQYGSLTGALQRARQDAFEA